MLSLKVKSFSSERCGCMRDTIDKKACYENATMLTAGGDALRRSGRQPDIPNVKYMPETM